MIIFSSKSKPGKGVGSLPVAISVFFVVIVSFFPSFRSMEISFLDVNLPHPL